MFHFFEGKVSTQIIWNSSVRYLHLFSLIYLFNHLFMVIGMDSFYTLVFNSILSIYFCDSNSSSFDLWLVCSVGCYVPLTFLILECVCVCVCVWVLSTFLLSALEDAPGSLLYILCLSSRISQCSMEHSSFYWGTILKTKIWALGVTMDFLITWTHSSFPFSSLKSILFEFSITRDNF